MLIFNLLVDNLFTIPILSFILGILFSLFRLHFFTLSKFHSFLTYFILFCIGLKGGGALKEHLGWKEAALVLSLVLWGFVHPFISYWMLRAFTKVDQATSAAIAACFGSVSVMTFVAAVSFLDKLETKYDGFVFVALALMEVPAIISGLFLSRRFHKTKEMSTAHLFKESFFNKTILVILLGIILGLICNLLEMNALSSIILLNFKPFLCLFLFGMGLRMLKHREVLKKFSWSLLLFGILMPLIGAAIGISLSYLFDLNAGTATLISILIASASYIAVPAAMRIALPEAQESIYLPLSIGVAFPFNVVIGIPIYYQVATKVVS